MRILTIIIVVSLSIFTVTYAERWPMGPGDEPQPLINNCYNFQDYGANYYHDGLDIYGDAGDPVYSVSDGYIVEKNLGTMYGGIFVNYSATGQDLGWTYWHIPDSTMPFNEGDAVSLDDHLGDIATWPDPAGHHTHFLRSRYPGNGGEWYDAVENVIEFVDPPDETQAPTFTEAEPGQMFSFCVNNTDTVVDPTNVSGQVDIIANIADKIVDTTWDVAPYEVDWWVEDDTATVVEQKLFMTFTGEFPPKHELVDVCIKDSGIWNSKDMLYPRDYYYIVSNTDGDGDLEATDSLYAFYSNSLSNGDYTLYVRARDFVGNETTESMPFTINNSNGENMIDVVQVLDASGSMAKYTTEDSVETKISVLRYAADEFLHLMKPDIGNKLGIVQFSDDVVPFSAPTPDLKELTAGNVSDFENSIDSIDWINNTSIGDGLREAFNQLSNEPSPNPVQFILLISDGKENSEEWISDVQDDLLGQNIAVYALGLGYSWGINEEKLTDLADVTGGDYRITSNDLEFRKFFMEVLGDAVNWEVITDPTMVITVPEDTTPVEVTEYDRKVTFTAYWEGEDADNAVKLTLISPNGIEITPEDAGSKIRYHQHPKYSFYQLNFPLSGNLVSEHAGTWLMKVTRSPRVESVRYAVSAFADSAIEFDVEFDKQSSLTGEEVAVTGLLTKGGIPLSGATIDVFCDVPLVSAGNVLHAGKIDKSLLDISKTENGDVVSLIDQKLGLLSLQAGMDVLERGEVQLKLFDDGSHGDNDSGDGLYANKFLDTDVAGSYTFRFVASGIPAGGGKTTTREWTKSFFNKVAINPDYSVIKTEYLATTGDGLAYEVTAVPKDKIGNYLGPGYEVYAVVKYAGAEREILLDDNIDGTYTKTIYLTPREAADGQIGIDVGDIEFAQVKLPEPSTPGNQWMASIHAGYAVPLSVFSNYFNPGFCVFGDVGYRIMPNLAIVGLFGYNRFGGIAPVADNYIINVNADVQYSVPISGPLSAYVRGGAGYYIPEEGDSKFGGNGGAGILYRLNNLISLGGGIDYHYAGGALNFTGVNPADLGKDAQFIQAHGGIVLDF